MSLKTLEGLPDEVAKLYKQGEDGEYHLIEAPDGLKSALQKERERANAAEKALKDREKTEAEALARKEREDLEKKGEYEKLSAADKAALKAAEERAQALDAKLRSGAIERAALEAVTSVKGIPKALLPHILPNLEAVPDGDGFAVKVKGDPAKKITDFVSSLKAEMAWGFEGSGASGSGAGQPGQGGGGTNARYAELMAKENRTNAEGLEMIRLGHEIQNATKP